MKPWQMRRTADKRDIDYIAYGFSERNATYVVSLYESLPLISNYARKLRDVHFDDSG